MNYIFTCLVESKPVKQEVSHAYSYEVFSECTNGNNNNKLDTTFEQRNGNGGPVLQNFLVLNVPKHHLCHSLICMHYLFEAVDYYVLIDVMKGANSLSVTWKEILKKWAEIGGKTFCRIGTCPKERNC